MTDKYLIEAPYVRSASGRLRDAVVSAPGAALDALVPLQGEPSPIVERAKEQHAILTRALKDLGVHVHPIEAHDEIGYASFVADCALTIARGAILLRPSRIERRREVTIVEDKLHELDVSIIGRIEAPGLLDGGDVVVCGEVAYLGVPAKGTGPASRSNTIGRSQLSAILAEDGIRTVELAIAPEIPRLSDVFSAVADDLVAAAPDYVDLAPLGSNVQVIAVPRGEQYGAGVLPVAPRRAIANLRFRIALPILRKAKIDIIAIDLWEFGKVGGGPSSLVLPLKRG